MSNSTQPIWPQEIKIIGVTGEYASGKTLFALTIDPPNTRVYDTEHSSASYQSLGFDRVSVQDKMAALKPNGYKPIDIFTWWWSDIKAIKPGQFAVVVIDTISEIEEGLVEWVQKNPGHFNHTAGQYQKMSGIMWGDVKSLWKSILSDLTTKVQTFVFAAHMSNVWSGDRPTGKRKPKGKETLMELASLYLLMERKANDKGQVAAKPSAIVLKSRLLHTGFDPESGELILKPCLPPRLPNCTPAEIRKYMNTPPDYKKLSKDECIPEDKMSADERALLDLAKAEAERDSERMKLERLGQQQQMMDQHREAQSAASSEAAGRAQTEGATPPSWPEEPADDDGQGKAKEAQLVRAKELKNLLTPEIWASLLGKHGAEKVSLMTQTQAASFLEEAEAAYSKNDTGLVPV